jgi:hypothetical protein
LKLQLYVPKIENLVRSLDVHKKSAIHSCG